ncbi:hypothetical protein BU15DRAFT_63518 [Melanogaster broomeanus]|nr:hypothetical protein BU15DRAFT_63518 [Melanogaster broomeanus]
MTRATSRRTPLAAVTITHLHRTPRFAPLLTPPPHNERSIHSRDDNDNDIDALVHVIDCALRCTCNVTLLSRLPDLLLQHLAQSQQHLTQPRRYVSLRLFSLTNRSPAVSTCPDDSWDDMDNCGKCLDYSYGGPCLDRELFRPWRKKSPTAIEAEQQLKEDKHPTKKHARVQKVTRPLTQTKQLSSAFRTVGWTGPIPNAVPCSSKRQPQYSTHTILRQSRIAATTITHAHVLRRGSPDCSIPISHIYQTARVRQAVVKDPGCGLLSSHPCPNPYPMSGYGFIPGCGPRGPGLRPYVGRVKPKPQIGPMPITTQYPSGASTSQRRQDPSHVPKTPATNATTRNPSKHIAINSGGSEPEHANDDSEGWPKDKPTQTKGGLLQASSRAVSATTTTQQLRRAGLRTYQGVSLTAEDEENVMINASHACFQDGRGQTEESGVGLQSSHCPWNVDTDESLDQQGYPPTCHLNALSMKRLNGRQYKSSTWHFAFPHN